MPPCHTNTQTGSLLNSSDNTTTTTSAHRIARYQRGLSGSDGVGGGGSGGSETHHSAGACTPPQHHPDTVPTRTSIPTTGADIPQRRAGGSREAARTTELCTVAPGAAGARARISRCSLVARAVARNKIIFKTRTHSRARMCAVKWHVVRLRGRRHTTSARQHDVFVYIYARSIYVGGRHLTSAIWNLNG